MSDLLYPGTGSATSVETIFIDGYRFDICEVHPEFDEYLAPKGKHKRTSARFFVDVEEQHIVNYDYAEKLHSIGCENRWDAFCMDRSIAREKINSFEIMLKEYQSIVLSLEKTPAKVHTLQPKINYLKDRILVNFGINL